jgi:putative ATP-dependent endonuclease of OLD family
MLIERLRIKNLRGIEEVTIPLHPRLTVLVGANNAGKTTVLDAIAAIVAFRKGTVPFSDIDFRAERVGCDIRNARAIQVEITIAPTNGSQFLPGELGEVLPSIDQKGHERVLLRLTVEFSHDPGVQSLDASLKSLNLADQPIRDFNTFPFRDRLPFRAFGSDRDFRRGMGSRWTDWGQILAEIRPDALTFERVTEFFQKGSDFLIDETPAFRRISEALSPAGRAVGLLDAEVKLTAVPQDLEEMLQRILVEMRLPGAPRAFSAERHGKGTQGALLFAVYRLYVERILGADGTTVSPVLTVEEPEAHLHPTAQRAIAKQLEVLPGQVIVTSHSPELVQPMSGRTVLLRARAGKTTAHVADVDHRSLKDHPRALFARCILIAEGREGHMIPYFARALGEDLADWGVEIVNAGGQDSIPGLWECFGPPGYGFSIVCVTDADKEKSLRDFLKIAMNAATLDAVPTDPEAILCELRKRDYFACKWGCSIEDELVDIAPDIVDRALLEIQGDTFEQWRARRAKSRPKGRSSSSSASTFEELDDRAARVYRLSTFKAAGPHLARLLTKDGTDGTFVPQRFIDAIRRAVALARG